MDGDGELADGGDAGAGAETGASGDDEPELTPKIDGAKSRTIATSPPIRGIEVTGAAASG